ncbi:hypothetical protein HanPI659440_Chr12g0466441 [Helianthus annuus]|nr:hypothetical protein HanPI659440_Chr12g0466441 [Helianthus annuus]
MTPFKFFPLHKIKIKLNIYLTRSVGKWNKETLRRRKNSLFGEIPTQASNLQLQDSDVSAPYVLKDFLKTKESILVDKVRKDND